jgi:hypothetical protein
MASFDMYRWFSEVMNLDQGFRGYLARRNQYGDKGCFSTTKSHLPSISSYAESNSMSYLSKYAYSSSVPRTLAILTN